MSGPAVSVVIPARNETGTLPDTLASLRAQSPQFDYDVVVVDGDSTDGTVAVARDHGARVVHQQSGGIGAGRAAGAQVARGDVLAFVDADTVVREGYLDAMWSVLDRRDLAAASSRCRVTGPRRAKPMEWTINHVFPRLSRPVLPGFNLVVDADAYREVGGFPDVPNEDTAFSRRLGRSHATGYHRDVLVETSGRRFANQGLTGATFHYLRLDWRRLRARTDRGRSGDHPPEEMQARRE